jgi:Ca-activated chloride channel homolog
MKVNANDPKWTAYALGEISDETERAEIESALKESAEMRRLVEEIRATAGLLKEELQAEPAIQLTPAQREQIEKKATARGNWFGLSPAWAMAAAAAAIMLISFVVVRQLKDTGAHPPRESVVKVIPNTPAQPSINLNNNVVVEAPKSRDKAVAKKSGELIAQVADNHEPKSRLQMVPPIIGLGPERTKSDQDSPTTAIVNEKLERSAGHTLEEVMSARKMVKSEKPTVVTATGIQDAIESGPSTIQTLSREYLDGLPKLRNNVTDLVAVMGGVITPPNSRGLDQGNTMLMGTPASGIGVTRDGMNINETRYATGINTPSHISPDVVDEFKVVLSPADAEYGRGNGQVIIKDKKSDAKKSEEQKSSSNKAAKGAGVGSGSGAGTGIGSGSGPGAAAPAVAFKGNLFKAPGGAPGGAASTTTPVFNFDKIDAAELARLRGNLQPSVAEIRQQYFVNRPPLPPPPPPRPVNYQGTWPPPRYHLGWFNTEAYDHIRDNEFKDVSQDPLSTFSIDVDTASYSNMRRFLDQSQFPPIDAIRIEELVNYFDYEYKAPKDGKPFAANFELTEAPWNTSHRLLRIALKGREVNPKKRPNSNLVFLLDVSGSMGEPNKLPLVKQSMEMLLDKLTESDRIAIVTYSTEASLYLPAARGDQKEKVRNTIEQLESGGSTNGAGGIQLAYQVAQQNFIKGGINRVILATDGDFNVGITDRGSLTRMIEEKADTGIFLSALGYGMGNLKDSTLELLANKGRGNYAYIDTPQEAKKVLVDQMDSTLVAIAKDVKIQVEFNPAHVSAYRLIGYEDRVMSKQDFNNDAKKAGVIGAGHAITALYELIPSGMSPAPGVDPLKYQKQAQPSPAAFSDEVVTVKVRSKDPDKDTSVLEEFAIKETEKRFSQASPDFKFAAAVASFGMILRNSPYQANSNFIDVLNWATEGRGEDAHGYRAEFIRLVHRAMAIHF